MPVEHKNIVNADLHELLGASAAAINTVPHSDGAGNTFWHTPIPAAGWRYSSIGSPTTFTTPTSYTLVNVVGTSTIVMSDFTHNALGRITYTGAKRLHCHFVFDLVFKHSTGSGQDCFFDVFLNGSTNNAVNVHSADSANYQHVAFHADMFLSTNDYIEMYCKVASGNILIHAAYMFTMGMVMVA